MERFSKLLLERQYEAAEDVLIREFAYAEARYTFTDYQSQFKKLLFMLRHALKQRRITVEGDADLFSRSAKEASGHLLELSAMLAGGEEGTRSYLMQRCLQFAQRNFANPDFSVSTLANACHISERYLRDLFRVEMKQTPSSYITHIRIDSVIRKMHAGGIARCPRCTARSDFPATIILFKFLKRRPTKRLYNTTVICNAPRRGAKESTDEASAKTGACDRAGGVSGVFVRQPAHHRLFHTDSHQGERPVADL